MVNLMAVHTQKYKDAFGTYIPKLMKYLGTQNKTTQIYINSITEGIVFYAYINKVDPTVFQKTVIRQKPNEIGFVHAIDLGNIHITTKSIDEIYCLSRGNMNKTLYVTNINSLKTNELEKVVIVFNPGNSINTSGLVYNVNDVKNKNLFCQKQN